MKAANKPNGETQSVKYGSFLIQDGVAHWNTHSDVQVKIKESASDYCRLEGLWKPEGCKKRNEYNVAMTGLCIWGKHDCVFKFASISKGNGGATRSLANPKEQQDLIQRVKNGHKVEKILISKDPFGEYQLRLIGWQADSVSYFGIKKLYYALPLYEYILTVREFENHLPGKWVEEINLQLNDHYNQLKEKIISTVDAEVEFIHPTLLGKMSATESYTWPYRNLDLDLGIEDMNEMRIVYQAMKNGAKVPPILLAVLNIPDPYYKPRDKAKCLALI